jgi:uncharacterized membrane protein YkoI
MKQAAIFRMLNRLGAFGILTLLAFLAGCADNTTGPAPTDQNPPGTNATVVISDPVSQAEADSVRDNVRRNSSDTIIISFDEAISVAIAQLIGGELLGVTLDYDSDTLNYECVVRQHGRVYVVVIDPKTGRSKKKEEIADTAYYYPGVIIIRPIIVKVKEAKEKAKKVSDGDVVECNLESIDGQPTYVVVILTRDNRYVRVFIDSETGKEKKVSDGGSCEDDKGKKKKGRGHYRHGRGRGYGHYHHCHCECGNGGGGDTTGVDTTDVPDGVMSKDSANMVARATISRVMLDSIAIDSVVITETKLEVKNDSTAFYTIKIESDSNRFELVQDAFTGTLISIKQTSGNLMTSNFAPPTVGTDSLVTLAVARTAALAQVAGAVQSWKLENDATEGKWVYTFSIKATGTGDTKQVLVDAKTGLFIKIK